MNIIRSLDGDELLNAHICHILCVYFKIQMPEKHQILNSAYLVIVSAATNAGFAAAFFSSPCSLMAGVESILEKKYQRCWVCLCVLLWCAGIYYRRSVLCACCLSPNNERNSWCYCERASGDIKCQCASNFIISIIYFLLFIKIQCGEREGAARGWNQLKHKTLCLWCANFATFFIQCQNIS